MISVAMAGEIQEPFALNFQADSLHSGSISFGRFEAELLSWERRSSFSHNRYLEEVEKFSKPGSVTEKKAYFEAHFRRKALLSQSSSECQSGMDYQTSENDTSEHMGYSQEFEPNNEGSHSIQFDKSSVGSEYDGDIEVEYDGEHMRTPYVEPVFQPTPSDARVVVQSVCEHVNPEEAHQIETKILPVIDAEPEKQLSEKLNDEAENGDVSSKAIQLSTSCPTHMKVHSASLEHQQKSSLKVGSKSGSKLVKANSRSLVHDTSVQRNKPIRTETEGSWSTKTKKQSSQTAAPTTRYAHRTSKPEEFCQDSTRLKLKLIHDSRSEKELKSKKIVDSKPSESDNKAVPKARRTTNRPKQAESSTKPGLKQSSALFNFKSDKQAERRKEFLTKIEEKLHAKEAEINQIQAKRLEKTEAELKQLRKSLNFRAKPMPSFYHEDVQRVSDKEKVVSCNTKYSKLTSRSAPGCRAAGRSPSCAKAGNDQAPFNVEHAKTSDPPQISFTNQCSLTSVPSETRATSRTQQDETYSEVTGRKERLKENELTIQKRRVSGSSSMVAKGQIFNGKHKVEVGRGNNGMVRKDMKGVGIGSSASAIGRLAVGVAS